MSSRFRRTVQTWARPRYLREGLAAEAVAVAGDFENAVGRQLIAPGVSNIVVVREPRNLASMLDSAPFEA